MDWLAHACADAGKPCTCGAVPLDDASGTAQRAGRRLTRAERGVVSGNRPLALEAIRHAAHEVRALERERAAYGAALASVYEQLAELERLAASWQSEHDAVLAETGFGMTNHDPARLAGQVRRLADTLAGAGVIG